MKDKFIAEGKQELAQVFGVSTTTVDNWIGRGVPVIEKGRRYRFYVPDVIQWLGEREDDGLDLTSERAALARAQREKAEIETKIKRLECAEIERKLLPVDLVVATWQAQLMAARSRLLSLPSKVAYRAHAASSAPEVETIIRDQVYEALTQLSEEGLPPHIRKMAEEHKGIESE